MDLSAILEEIGGIHSCYEACRVVYNRMPSSRIRKIISKSDPWGENPSFSLKHIKGNYRVHFVVQIGKEILDPLITENGLILINNYLECTYENSEDLKLV